MQLGILGLPKVGKTTLFNTLTSSALETDKFATSSKIHLGLAQVPDPRLAALRDLFQPRRYTPATVEYLDIPGMRKGEGSESLDLAKLKTVDALVHVVRSFEDPELLHSAGELDPVRDIASLDVELILADLILVEGRLGRLAKKAKGGLSPDDQKERTLLAEQILPALEEERPLRELDLEPDNEKRLRGFQLLSAKPLLVVLNVGEDGIAEGEARVSELEVGARVQAVTISATIEEEISRLPGEEQREFLGALGLEGPSLDRLIRASYELLGQISFFTVGEDEVRAWTIRHDTIARLAAGSIHSDIERGFIRAEVTSSDDLLRLGSLAACREQGLLRLEGKDYPVQDGEVVHFRFNV